MRRYTAVTEDKRYIVTIDKMGLFGEGIAKIEEGTVFVPFAAVGEVCEIKAIERRKHFINAIKLKTIKPSPYAATPKCKHFTACGGCQLQNLDYEIQVEQKRQILQNFVNNKLESTLTVSAIACPHEYGYRTRIRLRQHEGKVGFFQNRSLSFIPIEACPIAVPEINAWLQDNNNFPRPETNHDISLDLDSTGSVQTYEGAEQNQMGFRQVNAWGEQTLQSLIQQACKDKVEKGILELYCGAGGLTLSWFKPQADQQYFGIDNDGVNIQNAMQTYQQSNINFAIGHLPEWLIKQQIEQPNFCEQFDVIVLDPARGGVGKSLKKLAPMPSIKKWLYVSCNPVSWYKDVKTLLHKHNLALTQVTLIDMFPQTRHFEIFSVLT